MSTENGMVIVTRAPGAPRVTSVSVGPTSLSFVGDGPWEVTAEEWAHLREVPAGRLFVAEEGTTPEPLDQPAADEPAAAEE